MDRSIASGLSTLSTLSTLAVAAVCGCSSKPLAVNQPSRVEQLFAATANWPAFAEASSARPPAGRGRHPVHGRQLVVDGAAAAAARRGLRRVHERHRRAAGRPARSSHRRGVVRHGRRRRFDRRLQRHRAATRRAASRAARRLHATRASIATAHFIALRTEADGSRTTNYGAAALSDVFGCIAPARGGGLRLRAAVLVGAARPRSRAGAGRQRRLSAPRRVPGGDHHQQRGRLLGERRRPAVRHHLEHHRRLAARSAHQLSLQRVRTPLRRERQAATPAAHGDRRARRLPVQRVRGLPRERRLRHPLPARAQGRSRQGLRGERRRAAHAVPGEPDHAADQRRRAAGPRSDIRARARAASSPTRRCG